MSSTEEKVRYLLCCSASEALQILAAELKEEKAHPLRVLRQITAVSMGCTEAIEALGPKVEDTPRAGLFDSIVGGPETQGARVIQELMQMFAPPVVSAPETPLSDLIQAKKAAQEAEDFVLVDTLSQVIHRQVESMEKIDEDMVYPQLGRRFSLGEPRGGQHVPVDGDGPHSSGGGETDPLHKEGTEARLVSRARRDSNSGPFRAELID
jgi:hypothetical protein